MALFLLLLRRLLLLLLLSALQLNIMYRVYCLNPNMAIVLTPSPPLSSQQRCYNFCMAKDEAARSLCRPHPRDFWVNAWLRAVERTTSMLYSDRWQSIPCNTQFHVENTVFFSVRSCCNVMVKQQDGYIYAGWSGCLRYVVVILRPSGFVLFVCHSVVLWLILPKSINP